MKLQNPFLILSLLLSLLIVSCSNNDDPITDEPQQFNYLESEKFVSTISQGMAQVSFTVLASQFDEAAGLANEVSNDASVFKLVYTSTFQGEEISVSGLVALPDQSGNFPVISFQNGTNVEHSRAPSANPNSNLFRILESVATMGFIVVIPDYPGFGESEQVLHPYLERDNTLPSLLDMLKATREFVGQSHIKASLNDELFLMGYSQGGWSTLQLQKAIEEDGLESYQLKASSSGAGPYNLSLINSNIVALDTYPMPYFLAYLMHAYQQHGQFSNALNEIFADEYAAKIPDLFDGVTSGASINDELTTTVADLLQPTYRSGYESNDDFASIRQAFSRNSVTAWETSIPTRLYHGTSDLFVPPVASENLKTDFEELGLTDDDVRLILMPDADHQSGILPFGFASLNWFLSIRESSQN